MTDVNAASRVSEQAVFERTGVPMQKTTEGGVSHLVIDVRRFGD